MAIAIVLSDFVSRIVAVQDEVCAGSKMLRPIPLYVWAIEASRDFDDTLVSDDEAIVHIVFNASVIPKADCNVVLHQAICASEFAFPSP